MAKKFIKRIIKRYIYSLIGVLWVTTLSAQYSVTNIPEILKQEGDNKYELFKTETNKQFLGFFPFDEQLIYTSLFDLYHAYILADSLYRENEKSGIDGSESVKDIAQKLTEVQVYFLSGGVYYFEQKDYTKSSRFFEIHANYPQLIIFTDKRIPTFVASGDEPVSAYYAAITAYHAKDYNKTTNLLKKITENYVPNDTYKESDVYELLAQNYKEVNNNLYLKTLEDGFKKFPSNKFFLASLVEEYLLVKEYHRALQYIDDYITQYPDEACTMISTKGSLMTHIPQYSTAGKYYKAALEKDKNCLPALEGSGVLNVLMAQDLTNEISANSLNKRKLSKANKKILQYYKKALPYFIQYYDLLPNNNTEAQKKILGYLKNVYYNLGKLGVNSDKELKAIQDKLTLFEIE